jgi:hypothetical protein
VENIYFQLTRELNAAGPIAVLASGQAVVFYRLAMMSKDGDWILLETAEACRRTLDVLARNGARYRPGAPLDVRWLAAGWSSHFEFFDRSSRRIRCDFLTRPPRLAPETIADLFRLIPPAEQMPVLPVETLILIKQTQRAKDYPVIGELARLLPPEREIELTTDPDRILALTQLHGRGSNRPAVRAAQQGCLRDQVVVELAREIDQMQAADRARLERFRTAAEPYLRQFQSSGIAALELPEAHREAVGLALKTLPLDPLAAGGPGHGTAQ